MTQLRSVNTHFWKDSFILDCSTIERLIFLYLLTNEATTLAGCYEITLRRISFDTGASPRVVASAIEKFQKAGKLEYRDGWIALRSFHKHQNLNTNMGIAAGKFIRTAPEWVREYLRKSLVSLGTLPEWFPNHSETIKGIEVEGNRKEAEAAKPRKPVAKPQPRGEVEVWLDAIASQVGAKDRSTLANVRNWREIVEIALKENRHLPDLLAVVNSELDRLSDMPQFFTPAGVLKQLQLGSVGKQQERLPTIDEIDAKRKENMVLKPVPKAQAI